MPRIDGSQLVDKDPLFRRSIVISVPPFRDGQEPVVAKPSQSFRHFLLRRVKALGRRLDIPYLVRIISNQQQGLQLGNRINVPEDEVPNLRRNRIIHH